MTGANGGAAPDALLERRWDVALSFAGAQRDYVGQVAEALKARGLRCFYDADEQTELWGRYLADELPAIYGEQAAAVVMFVSAEYAAREWTRLERQATLARAVRERREYVLPARFDDTPLPGLPSDMVTVDLRTRTPQQFAAVIADKLAALAASAALAGAGGPAQGARPARPAGAVRVSEADPRRLGVHAAISVPGVPGEVLPEYVARDVDAGARAKVTAAAAERGGFVLLVGGSSVGKTRSAVEAVKALLPDWWLVHPAGPDQVAALAAAPPLRTVVWLDELQRYLDGEHGLTGPVVRALLNASHPVVIIGTMWPDFYEVYTAMPTSRSVDPHSREREVLDLAMVVRLGVAFSPAEQDRARAAAPQDPRLRVALDTAGYGLTQTLAAAPQLIARWEDAKSVDPYAWAVLTAALDAARLGARAPLNADLLRAAAPGYCTGQQRAEAPEDWLEQALAYATTKLNGAAAAISPVGAGMGQVAGYTVADYLVQHASQERRAALVPASIWDAVLAYVHDPADTVRLADSAKDRRLYRYAISLYGHATDAGDRFAAIKLADLQAERGDQDGAEQILRARYDAGDRYAGEQLADLLAKRGDLDGAEHILRDLADTGGGMFAASKLVGLLYKRRDRVGLRARYDAGDRYAGAKLADLLAESSDRDGAEHILRDLADTGDWSAGQDLDRLLYERGDLDGLRARADAGDEFAAAKLARLQAERGDRDGAEQILRARADDGDGTAARELADLLYERGDRDGAEQILRSRADDGDGTAARELVRLLYERGDLDGLRARADAGDEFAANELANLLAERGDLDRLRGLADDADNWYVGMKLDGLLAERGDEDGLRARASAGDSAAVSRLHGLLTKQGRGQEAERLRRFGLNPDGSIACA
jgi:hypothetical protein